jgi:hypothetical protein
MDDSLRLNYGSSLAAWIRAVGVAGAPALSARFGAAEDR